jgi:hypothetical protein
MAFTGALNLRALPSTSNTFATPFLLAHDPSPVDLCPRNPAQVKKELPILCVMEIMWKYAQEMKNLWSLCTSFKL